MRTFLLLILSFSLIFFLAGCGGSDEASAEEGEEVTAHAEPEDEGHGGGEEAAEGGEGEEAGKTLYKIDNVIINPAGTAGSRLLVMSLAIMVEAPEDYEMLASNEMVLKDRIINTVSSKNLRQLTSPGYKDSLKLELADELAHEFEDLHIQRILFDRYAIQ